MTIVGYLFLQLANLTLKVLTLTVGFIDHLLRLSQVAFVHVANAGRVSSPSATQVVQVSCQLPVLRFQETNLKSIPV